MAAPSTDQSTRITVGVLWRIQVEPPPPRPPRLSVAVTVGRSVITLAQIIFGVVYFKDCPQQPNIPNYLLGLALLQLLMIPYVTLPCESHAALHPKGVKFCLLCLIGLSYCIWIPAGNVWVFSVYQPNYDPAAAGGLYCDKTLYTFAFWNAVLETFVVCVILGRLCKGLLCCVMMSPAPTNRQSV